ncbi:WhiB family transcriptional regulator [Mycobacterium colombiense]
MNTDELLDAIRSQPDLSAGTCVGEPEMWSSPDDPGLVDRAIELCLQCPVYQLCAEWASGLPEGCVHGVVGGQVHEWLSPAERWRRRKARAAA